MADQGEQVPQVPAGETFHLLKQSPHPLLQNQEEPDNPNPRQYASAGEVTLAVYLSVLFSRFQHVFLHIVSPLQF